MRNEGNSELHRLQSGSRDCRIMCSALIDVLIFDCGNHRVKDLEDLIPILTLAKHTEKSRTIEHLRKKVESLEFAPL